MKAASEREEKLLQSAIDRKDNGQVNNLLKDYTFTDDTLSWKLVFYSLGGSSIDISDLLAKNLNYNLTKTIFFFAYAINKNGFSDEDCENIADRLLFLAERRYASIDYAGMKAIMTILTLKNDIYIAKFLNYFLNTQHPTMEQVKELLNVVNEELPNGKTANIPTKMKL